MAHDWMEGDDMVALYLARHGTDRVTLDDVENVLGIRRSAMTMRMANFRALDGGSGLGNASRQSQGVHQRMGGLSADELEQRVVAYLAERRG